MSSGYSEYFNIELESVIAPEVDLRSTNWITEIPASEVSIQSRPTTSYDSTGFTIDFIPPNITSCVIDRSSAMLYVPINILGIGNAGLGNLYKPTTDCLRDYWSIVQSLVYEVGGGSLKYNPWQYYDAINWYTDNTKKQYCSLKQVDCCTNYSDLQGYVKSSFASYGDSAFNGITSRGSFPLTINSNTPTGFNISALLPIPLSDFPPFSRNKLSGLVIDPLKMNVTYVSNLNRIWCRDTITNTNLLTGLTVTMGQPSLTYKSMRIPENMSIPPTIHYPYHSISVYTTQNLSGITTGSTSYVSSNVLELSTMPSKFYVYVKASYNAITNNLSSTVSTPDFYMPIFSADITLDTRTSLMTKATQQDLYEISLANGYQGSYVDFIGQANGVSTAGSILCVSPIHDFGLTPDMLIGEQCKNNIQFNLTIGNTSQYSGQVSMYIVAVYDGLLTVNHGLGNPAITLYHSPESLKLSDKSWHELNMDSLYGGESIFRRLWNGIKRGHQMLKDKKIISKSLSVNPSPWAQVGSQVADFLGYGDGGEEGNSGEGGILVGGKRMSRSDMMKHVRSFKRV